MTSHEGFTHKELNQYYGKPAAQVSGRKMKKFADTTSNDIIAFLKQYSEEVDIIAFLERYPKGMIK